jgi:3-methyladenine DNA glycosylase AlkD
MTLAALKTSLRSAAHPGLAAARQRFFKTGPGDYAEGDRFLGVCVPAVRKLVRHADGLSAEGVRALVEGSFHEERLLGLLLWVRRFERGDAFLRRTIHRDYLARTAWINNWDLVDASAPQLVGGWLLDHPAERKTLARLARSRLLWERRIAMLATFAFIRAGDVSVTFEVAGWLVHDSQDLMHKAVGWMLREAGKRDEDALRRFLTTHAATMPRTALRSAIERLVPQERQFWREAAVVSPPRRPPAESA